MGFLVAEEPFAFVTPLHVLFHLLGSHCLVVLKKLFWQYAVTTGHPLILESTMFNDFWMDLKVFPVANLTELNLLRPWCSNVCPVVFYLPSDYELIHKLVAISAKMAIFLPLSNQIPPKLTELSSDLQKSTILFKFAKIEQQISFKTFWFRYFVDYLRQKKN